MKGWTVALAVSLCAAVARPALADEAAQKYVREKAQLLERGFRDDDWGGMIEIAHDVLMRVPGDPVTLKWAGIALAQTGARRLAVRALEESLRQKDDAEAKKTLAQLRQSFTTVRIEVSDVPNDPAVSEALMQLGAPLQPKGAERPTLPGLSEADRKKLAERVANIEKLGGIPPAKPTVERGMSALTFVYKDVEVTAPTVKLHASLDKAGLEDVDLELQLKAGDKTFASVRLTPQASLTVTGGGGDSLTLDGKPIAATGVRVKPGTHVLARVRNGMSWPADITVGAGEKKTVALDAAWAEIDVDGWKSGDQLLLGGRAVEAPGGRLFVPPGAKVELKWKRGPVEVPFSTTAAAGPPVHLAVPALVRVSGDDPALSVELSGPTGPMTLASGSVTPVPAGTLAMTARLPGREPMQRTLTVAPGEDVLLDLSRRGFSRTPETERVEAGNQHTRKIGLVLIGVGAGLGGLAAASAGLYGWQKSVGDDAYASYMAATNVTDVANYRQNVLDASGQQWFYGAFAIGLGAGAVACLGAGIWELKRRAR
jgi:hypothetical protein